MGGGRWDSKDWSAYSTTHVAGKTVDKIYTSKRLKEDLDPRFISIRESRDSVDNPNSNAIIIALDVTGSMGCVLKAIITKLGGLLEEIYDRKPVSDPHVMCMGIGDVFYDRAPLQVTQFEADIRIAEQLKEIYLEQGGGGNSSESYHLPWYFAAKHTAIDCFEKRKKKGYLFTIGDEQTPPTLTKDHIEKVFGKEKASERDYTTEEILDMVSDKYEIYHLMVAQGSHFRSHGEEVRNAWGNLLGQRAIELVDYEHLPETIVSIIQATEGECKATIVDSWKDKSTALTVQEAIKDIVPAANKEGIVVL